MEIKWIKSIKKVIEVWIMKIDKDKDKDQTKEIELHVVGQVENKTTLTLGWNNDFYLLETVGNILLNKTQIARKRAERWARIHLGDGVANNIKNSKLYKE